MSCVNKYLNNIQPYKTSSHKVWEVSATERDNILKLDWNEATVSPSSNVVEALKCLLKEGKFLNLYPNTLNVELLNLLSKYTGVPIENIQYFASSDVVHEYLCRILLEKGKKILIQAPAYDNFRLTAQSNGAEVYFSEVNDNDYKFNEKKFECDITSVKPDVVYICCPNNPIGYVTSNSYIEHLLNSFPNIIFLIDEAYYEFSTQPSASCFVTKYNNIFVSRTMSKAFALANLRFGYVLSSKENIQSLNLIRNPKNVNTFTQTAVIATLQDIGYMKNYVKETNKAKKYFISAMQQLTGIVAYDSEANFVLIKFDSYGLKMNMFRWLKKHDIFVREISQSPIVYKCLRITIGNVEQMKHVVKVMQDFYKQTPIKKYSDKIALFDFCDTMVDFQTGNAFLQYVISHSGISFYKKVRYNLKHFFNKKLTKLYLLQCCSGITKQQMEKLALAYYYEVVRPRLLATTVGKVLHYQSTGYKIYIVSGGFDMYLRYFVEEFALDGLLSTKVEFKDNICTGRFDGIDCMGENKIRLLKTMFDKTNIDDSVAFSDSITDLPLLRFVKHGFVVCPSINSCAWAKQNNLETLVYVPGEYYKC